MSASLECSPLLSVRGQGCVKALADKVIRQVAKPPFVQIEITRKCNFEYFYCAGRHMKQENMSWELFNEILGKPAPGSNTVALQGEGESTAHP